MVFIQKYFKLITLRRPLGYGKVTAAQVKELREKTGVGMMDAKKALVAVDGDMDKLLISCVKKVWQRLLRRATVLLLKV